MSAAGQLREAWLRTGLWGGVLATAVHLSWSLPVTVDLTWDQRHSLSPQAVQRVGALRHPARLRVFATADLPAPYHQHRQRLVDLAHRFADASGGQLQVEVVDVSTAEGAQDAQDAGVAPLTVMAQGWDRTEARQAFLGAVVEQGARAEALPRLVETSRMEAELAAALGALQRGAEGPPVVGWVTGHGEPDTRAMAPLRDAMARVRVQPVDLSAGGVPAGLDALLWFAPSTPVSQQALQAVDRYLAGGGAVGLFVQGQRPQAGAAGLVAVPHGLGPLLGPWGVQVGALTVVDPAHGAPRRAPVAVGEHVALAQVPYGLVPQVSQRDLGHPVSRALGTVELAYPVPVELARPLPDGLQGSELLRSSEQAFSWAEPPLRADLLMRPPDTVAQGARGLAVAVQGRFAGAFPDGTPQPYDAASRLVVVGSAEPAGAVPLIQSSLDWLLADPAMADIRGRALRDRPLRALSRGEAVLWRLGVLGSGLASLGLLALFRRWRLR